MRNQLCWFVFIVNLTQLESSGKKETQLGNGLIWLILTISVRANLGLWLTVPATWFLHGFPQRWTVTCNGDEINISSLTWFGQSINHRNKKQIRQNVNLVTSIDCCIWQTLSIIWKLLDIRALTAQNLTARIVQVKFSGYTLDISYWLTDICFI